MFPSLNTPTDDEQNYTHSFRISWYFTCFCYRKIQTRPRNRRISINTPKREIYSHDLEVQKILNKKYTICVNILNIIIKCIVDLSYVLLDCLAPGHFILGAMSQDGTCHITLHTTGSSCLWENNSHMINHVTNALLETKSKKPTK